MTTGRFAFTSKVPLNEAMMIMLSACIAITMCYRPHSESQQIEVGAKTLVHREMAQGQPISNNSTHIASINASSVNHLVHDPRRASDSVSALLQDADIANSTVSASQKASSKREEDGNSQSPHWDVKVSGEVTFKVVLPPAEVLTQVPPEASEPAEGEAEATNKFEDVSVDVPSLTDQAPRFQGYVQFFKWAMTPEERRKTFDMMWNAAIPKERAQFLQTLNKESQEFGADLFSADEIGSIQDKQFVPKAGVSYPEKWVKEYQAMETSEDNLSKADVVMILWKALEHKVKDLMLMEMIGGDAKMVGEITDARANNQV
mmetsp:Transcript_41522/g.74484  ORF Transcript_41522/g.74484 Transcript_41522/m.74484 type:complete len:317 (+) Transcript_41522:68-1018(+)